MREKLREHKLFFLVLLLLVLILSYAGLSIYNVYSLKRYDEEFLPNTYLERFDMTSYTFEHAHVKIDFYEDYILDKKIVLEANSNPYEYTLKELGVSVDQEKTIEQVRKYQKSLGYSKKLMIVNNNIQKTFPFLYKVDTEVLQNVLLELRNKTSVEAVNGFFDVSEGVHYNSGVNGFNLDIQENVQTIVDYVSKSITEGSTVKLVGEEVVAQANESYKTIDTMTSSFVTTFMPYSYYRNINLNTALNYINGTILEPGEVFSYCKTAGPFNRTGYVFYYEFVGNGVCQIATTTYNAALLGGLEILKRYPHAKKSLYVAGGLDATVASYSSGWCVDMQFKNTYDYPIYIKAYSVGDQAHVEFWSNHDAKKGLEYTTSSTKIGVRGYRTFLHTWKDGEEIDVQKITDTWYTEE